MGGVCSLTTFSSSVMDEDFRGVISAEEYVRRKERGQIDPETAALADSGYR